MMWPNSIAIWVVVSMALLGYGDSVDRVMSGGIWEVCMRCLLEIYWFVDDFGWNMFIYLIISLQFPPSFFFH